MTLCDLETALQKGRSYLERIQKSDGSFPIDPTIITAPTKSQTITTQALLLSILSNSSNKDAGMCDALARWLMQYDSGRIIDAFDTDPCATFHVLAAISTCNVSLINQTVVAKAVHYLLQSEVQPGGPYSDKSRKDAQPEFLTNTGIARFLRRIADPLPELDQYILRTADVNKTSLLDWHVLYYLHELFPERYTLEKVVARAFSLEESLTFIQMTNQLVQLQRPDGSWPLLNNQSGDELALGTALALTTLEQHTSKQSATFQFEQLYEELTHSASDQSATLDVATRTTLLAAFENTIKADHRFEIGPLAARFATALPSSINIDPQIIHHLGLANIYTWVAYTIYDNFLDDEGEPLLLSSANIAHRRSLQAYMQALPDHAAFQKFVQKTFDGMDDINTWEITCCRAKVQNGHIQITELPDYCNDSQLSSRSLVHILPIMGILAAAHISLSSETAKDICTAFQDYLTVRQLLDDLRDWKEDLHAGHLSYVVAKTLRSAKITAGSYKIEAILPLLERQFWENTLPTTSSEIQQRIKHANAMLDHNAIIVKQSVIHELLHAMQVALDGTIYKWRTANQFLAAYIAQDL